MTGIPKCGDLYKYRRPKKRDRIYSIVSVEEDTVNIKWVFYRKIKDLHWQKTPRSSENERTISFATLKANYEHLKVAF